MGRRVVRLDRSRLSDFFRLHSSEGAGWCYCVAWWVASWDGWGERSAAENRRLRENLCAEGEYDGYLLYQDEAPVGWCQVGRRDRLTKLASQFHLEADPSTWAITCFYVAPSSRGQGLARFLLESVLRDLRARGAVRVEAFPGRGEALDAGELWTGPEPLFLDMGFEVVRDDPRRPVLALVWGPGEDRVVDAPPASGDAQ